MSDHTHWWILEAPGPDGTPSACRDCPATKVWPRLKYLTLADGRPFITKDPLLRRAERIYSLGGWRD